MSKRFLLGWSQSDDQSLRALQRRLLSNRIKSVMGDPQGMFNYMTYRDAIGILEMDPASIYSQGRIDLDPKQWADLGWMCLFPGPPEPALRAMREAVTADKVGPYSPDLLTPLRAAAARKFGRERGPEFEVIGTEGAQAGVSLATLAFLNPGDEVIITDPGYFHFVPAVLLAGGVPVRIPLGPHNGYRLDPDEVRSRITPRTKMIMVCDPVNPFGTVQTRDELRAIAALAAEHDVVVVNDITHNAHRISATAEQVPMAALGVETDTRHVVSTFGMSHGYGMAGIRMGFLAGHPDLMRACIIAKVGLTRLNTNLISQYGSLAALADESYRQQCEEIVRRNYAHARETVERTPGLTIPVEPQYGFSMVMDVAGTGVTAQELTVALFKRRVAVYPGDGLGDVGATRYMRINLSRPDTWAMEHFREMIGPAITEARTGVYRDVLIDLFRRKGTERGTRIVQELMARR